MADVTTAEEEPTYALLLTSVGDKKIQVIKEVRAASGLDLQAALDLTNKIQAGWRKTVITGPAEVVEQAAQRLRGAGATVEVHPASELAMYERYVHDDERLQGLIRTARDLAQKMERSYIAGQLDEALRELES